MMIKKVKIMMDHSACPLWDYVEFYNLDLSDFPRLSKETERMFVEFEDDWYKKIDNQDLIVKGEELNIDLKAMDCARAFKKDYPEVDVYVFQEKKGTCVLFHEVDLSLGNVLIKINDNENTEKLWCTFLDKESEKIYNDNNENKTNNNFMIRIVTAPILFKDYVIGDVIEVNKKDSGEYSIINTQY